MSQFSKNRYWLGLFLALALISIGIQQFSVHSGPQLKKGPGPLAERPLEATTQKRTFLPEEKKDALPHPSNLQTDGTPNPSLSGQKTSSFADKKGQALLSAFREHIQLTQCGEESLSYAILYLQGPSRSEATKVILDHWAKYDLHEMARFVGSLLTPGHRELLNYTQDLYSRLDPARAFSWSQSEVPAEYAEDLSRKAMNQWCLQNLSEAWDWLDSITNEQGDPISVANSSAVHEVVRAQAYQQFSTARERVEQMVPGKGLEPASASLVREWAESDPQGAQKWGETLLQDYPDVNFDQTVSALAIAASSQNDREAAYRWLAQIDEPDVYRKTKQTLQSLLDLKR